MGSQLVRPLALFATNITVGTHVQRTFLGLEINVDTVWATGAAMLIIFVLGMAVRRGATSGVPGKYLLVWETGVSAVRRQVQGSMGARGSSIVPLAVALFVFILVLNWFTVVGIGSTVEWLPAATGDINVTLALALVVIVPVHIASVRARGGRGYLRHYASQPFPKILFPVNVFINVVEEISKPVTLALRLFGNLLSGALMLALIAALGVWTIEGFPIGHLATLILEPLWKLFDLGIGVIQAFIFALLTILYFDAATSDGH